MNDNITSKVMGIVYTDIVAYILPGFLFLVGVLFLFENLDELLTWLKAEDTLMAVGFLIATIGVSYMVGSILSLLFWCFSIILERKFGWTSMSGLLQGKKSQHFFQKYTLEDRLPSIVRKKLRSRIKEDLEKQGFLKDVDAKDIPSEELGYFFWGILREASRESDSRLFQHWYRWDAVNNGRQNIIGVVFLLLLSLSVKIFLGSKNWGFFALTISILLLVSCFYLFIFPLVRSWHKRCFLISYLIGDLKPFDDVKKVLDKDSSHGKTSANTVNSYDSEP